MRETYKILPVYAGDVSGACSALYELGGMCVIHDPSGCNSTYNTFDETRWYDKESLIFLSGLTDTEAMLGDDSRFIRDVVETAAVYHPRFVALMNSPLPYLNGTDFRGICRLLELHARIPFFYVPTNGMHDYTVGAGKAFAQAALRLVNDTDARIPRGVNLLGLTPLDFAKPGAAAEFCQRLTQAGFSVVSRWALDVAYPEEIDQAGEAAVNLVLSSTGLPAAKILRERFGIPAVFGVPLDGFSKLIQALEESIADGEDRFPAGGIRQDPGEEPDCLLVGEPVMMSSLAALWQRERGWRCRVIQSTESEVPGLLCPWDRQAVGEEEIAAALHGAKRVAADPLFASVTPEGAELISLPHLAFSGRVALGNN